MNNLEPSMVGLDFSGLENSTFINSDQESILPALFHGLSWIRKLPGPVNWLCGSLQWILVNLATFIRSTFNLARILESCFCCPCYGVLYQYAFWIFVSVTDENELNTDVSPGRVWLLYYLCLGKLKRKARRRHAVSCHCLIYFRRPKTVKGNKMVSTGTWL